jgi:CBS domain-containing protein
MPVARWMRQPVVTIRMDVGAREAAELMRARQVRHLPVTGERGQLLGIVTDRDLRQVIFDRAIQERLGELSAVLEALPVREIMTWGVVTVTPETDLRAAARVMHEQKLGALPVVDDGRVVGILTEHDVFRVLREALRQRLKTVGPAAAPVDRQEYDPGIPMPADEEEGRAGDAFSSG